MTNTLFYGDNLGVLRKHVADASVDLVYLDPPFNSNRDYNVLFKEQSGADSPAQIKAFGDTWRWANAALDWDNFPELCPSPRVQDLMEGFVKMLGHNDVSAYLVMMAPRLWHLHRVLKPTGSLYLHCDPTAAAYLKILLDAIFGPKNFRNEIIWKRTSAHSSAKRFGPVHDVILYCTKSDNYVWNKQHTAYNESYTKQFYGKVDEDGRRYTLGDLTGSGTRNGETGKIWRDVDVTKRGRHWMVPPAELDILDALGVIYWPSKGEMPRLKRYLDEMQGVALQDIFSDISPVSAHAAERLGYPTQKPLALLERIISASSNPGDVVLDPFCGCGTAVVAAQQLGRAWIGIDVTPIATSLIVERLARMHCRDLRTVKAGDADFARAYKVEGLPTDLPGAQKLFKDNPKDFEMWAVSLIPVTPQDKKGADGGIDGIKDYFVGEKKPIRAVVQVKGGHVGAPQVQQLRGAMEKFGATLGLFLCLDAPTSKMGEEASHAGWYTLPLTGKKIPRLQIRTVGDLLDGHNFDLPSYAAPSQAVADSPAAIKQTGLDL